MANRLTVVDEETLEEVDGTFFNWGNVLRNSTAEKTFAVLNQSEDYTARSVTLTALDVTPGTADQVLFTLDGEVWVATLSLGDIPPAAHSAVVSVRRVNHATSASGTYTVELQAASWAVPNRDNNVEYVPEITTENEEETP